MCGVVEQARQEAHPWIPLRPKAGNQSDSQLTKLRCTAGVNGELPSARDL
jgi:hypothetical protein